MAYVLDTTAILAVLLNSEGAERVEGLLRAAARGPETRVMVPFMAMQELEHYLLRRLPDQAERVLALVESWPIEIVESYTQWRREAARLRSSLDLPPSMAWGTALALIYNAQLVSQDPAFDAVPGLLQTKLP